MEGQKQGKMEASTSWKQGKGDGTGVEGSRKRVRKVKKKVLGGGERGWEGECFTICLA